jgi:UDP-N-acetylglucosamine acyltransferase
MVAGHAAITRDVPHFTMVAERDDVIGFNVVGLKRRGVARAAIAELKAAFAEVYFTAGNIRAVAAQMLRRRKICDRRGAAVPGIFCGRKAQFCPRAARRRSGGGA